MYFVFKKPITITAEGDFTSLEQAKAAGKVFDSIVSDSNNLHISLSPFKRIEGDECDNLVRNISYAGSGPVEMLKLVYEVPGEGEEPEGEDPDYLGKYLGTLVKVDLGEIK